MRNNPLYGILHTHSIHIPDYLGSDQRLWFLDLYRKLTNYTCPEKKLTSAAHTHTPSTFTLTLTDTDEEVESECRRWCAYNLPVSWHDTTC